jgi:hypothetical protein
MVFSFSKPEETFPIAPERYARKENAVHDSSVYGPWSREVTFVSQQCHRCTFAVR